MVAPVIILLPLIINFICYRNIEIQPRFTTNLNEFINNAHSERLER